MSKTFRITWSRKIRARTAAEARLKAKRIKRPPVICVEEVPPPAQAIDPRTHCPHGQLWHVPCERC